jgi:hypothetical protein
MPWQVLVFGCMCTLATCHANELGTFLFRYRAIFRKVNSTNFDEHTTQRFTRTTLSWQGLIIKAYNNLRAYNPAAGVHTCQEHTPCLEVTFSGTRKHEISNNAIVYTQ